MDKYDIHAKIWQIMNATSPEQRTTIIKFVLSFTDVDLETAENAVHFASTFEEFQAILNGAKFEILPRQNPFNYARIKIINEG